MNDIERVREELKRCAAHVEATQSYKLWVSDWLMEEVLMSDKAQNSLFGNTGESWEDQWKGMPEFKQENLEPFRTVYVHFETREDVAKFEQLIKQRFTQDTKSIWYPEATINDFSKIKYVHDPSKDNEE